MICKKIFIISAIIKTFISKKMSSWSTTSSKGIYYFQKTVAGKKSREILRGISVSGLEYLPSTAAYSTPTIDITNILLSFFNPNDSSTQTIANFQNIIRNMVTHLKTEWNVNIIRIPICLSAYSRSSNVTIKFAGETNSVYYADLIKAVVLEITGQDIVALIDGHVWATAKNSEGSTVFSYPSGCVFNFTANGSPTNTQNYGNQSYSIQDLMTISSGQPLPDVITAWETIARDMLSDSRVWFELVNEPFFRPYDASKDTAEDQKSYKMDSASGLYKIPENDQYNKWETFFYVLLDKIRKITTTNIVVVNGLNRGYDFSTAIQVGAKVGTNLPFFQMFPKNLAFGVHPFQLSGCCGLVTSYGNNPNVKTQILNKYKAYENVPLNSASKGFSRDQSVNDPYESAYCYFYQNHTSPAFNTTNISSHKPFSTGTDPVITFDLPAANQNTALQTYTCNSTFHSSDHTKLPPCHAAPSTQVDVQTGYVENTYIGDCTPSIVAQLKEKKTVSSGWDKYFLGMQAYGPIIATAFGTFDCSLPYVKTFLQYCNTKHISWIAYGIQPYLPMLVYKNGFNPCNLNCLTISAIAPASSSIPTVKPVGTSTTVVGNYYECLAASNCAAVLSPIGNTTNQIGHLIKTELGTYKTTSSPSNTNNNNNNITINTFSPASGTTTAPGPGTTTAPGPGTTTAPGPGTTTAPGPLPGPGTTTAPGPLPGPGTTTAPGPIPGPGTTTAPGPGTTTAPGPGTTTAPGPIPGPGTTTAPANSKKDKKATISQFDLYVSLLPILFVLLIIITIFAPKLIMMNLYTLIFQIIVLPFSVIEYIFRQMIFSILRIPVPGVPGVPAVVLNFFNNIIYTLIFIMMLPLRVLFNLNPSRNLITV